MVIKTLTFPTEDLTIQANYLNSSVRHLCELPSSTDKDDLLDKLEEILRYADYHVECVASFHNLIGGFNNIDKDLFTNEIAKLLISFEQGESDIGHLQGELMRWYRVLCKQIAF